eukprot:scaffold64420_cov37-Tisochrysis_lutea.AAC.1
MLLGDGLRDGFDPSVLDNRLCLLLHPETLIFQPSCRSLLVLVSASGVKPRWLQQGPAIRPRARFQVDRQRRQQAHRARLPNLARVRTERRPLSDHGELEKGLKWMDGVGAMRAKELPT